MLPLVAQRLAGNIAALCCSGADVLACFWHILRELHRDACDELACVADVAAAAREEEAGRQALLVVVAARDGPRDRRLACARQAAQPEDAPLIWPVRPAMYLVEEVNACAIEAGRLVLLCTRVEGRINSMR